MNLQCSVFGGRNWVMAGVEQSTEFADEAQSFFPCVLTIVLKLSCALASVSESAESEANRI